MTDTDTQKLAVKLRMAAGIQRSLKLNGSPLVCEQAADALECQATRLTALEQQVFASDARLREAVERGAVVAEECAYEIGAAPLSSIHNALKHAAAAIRATIPTKEETDV